MERRGSRKRFARSFGFKRIGYEVRDVQDYIITIIWLRFIIHTEEVPIKVVL